MSNIQSVGNAVMVSGRQSVEARPGETYDEYRARANSVVRDWNIHRCPNCDNPMQSAYHEGRYWYCTSCGYGKERHKRAE